VSELDGVTTYYLLHRHDFGLEKVPVGGSILYALSCGLRDTDLVDRYDLLARAGGSKAAGDADEEDEGEEPSDHEMEESRSSGSEVRLKKWTERRRAGVNSAVGHVAPLIDRVHRLMHLWKAGDVEKVDDYLDAHGLRSSSVVRHLLQALIELSPPGDQERAILESISNHIGIEQAAEREIGLFEHR